jgi:hypothetical protein
MYKLTLIGDVQRLYGLTHMRVEMEFPSTGIGVG